MPPAFCGICGIKTSFGRLGGGPFMGCSFGSKNPHMNFNVTIGPMSRRVDDLVEIFRTVCKPEVFQDYPLIMPIPFNEQLF
jgi:Asp-tRNA(Asn)/Glu-tRNA(Gln) amidotransferase A subunit family amidase